MLGPSNIHTYMHFFNLLSLQIAVAYVSFVEQLLFVSEGEGGIDVCLKMRGFSTIELSASIATLQDTAIGKNSVC